MSAAAARQPEKLRILFEFIPETARRISATILRMVILGINAYHANASAAIIADGRLLAAVEEERLNRVKYAAGLPVRAIQYCLDQAGVKLSEVDHIAIPRNPWARLGTKLRFAMRMPQFALDRARVMRRFAGINEDLASAFEIPAEKIRAQFHRIEHHTAHLASAYFVSPFERAAVLSADGLGDFASSMWALGEGPRMQPLGEITFPHSLGMYYTALTQYIGFWKFGDEYKVMGLAAYGEPEFLEEFRRIVYADGAAFLPPRPGIFHASIARRGNDLARRRSHSRPRAAFFGHISKNVSGPRAKPTSRSNSAITIWPPACKPRSKKFSPRTGAPSREKPAKNLLCLAGGVAFNCVANGKIFDHSPFERVYVQPAAGDAGLSVGAAFAGESPSPRPPARIRDGPRRLGPAIFAAAKSATQWTNSPRANDDLQIAEQLDEAMLLRKPPRGISPTAKFSAGFKAASNGVRARSASAAFSPIRAARK